MTVKEAADLLDTLVGMVEDSHGADYDTALKMGIEALSAQQLLNQGQSRTQSSDYIRRQEAIDAIRTKYCPSDFMDDGVIDAFAEIIQDLPSAQPEPIRINLNEPIKVKLTDWGKEIYYHQYDRTNQIAGREICKPRFPREDENGYTEFQLWCFIELYGMHMGMTLPNVIEPLEIVYER